MAEPIPLKIPARDPARELQLRLQNAPAEHAAAILEGYEFLQTLHDSGTLDLLRGLVGQKDRITGQLAATVNEPGMIRGMRNLIVLTEALGSIKPESLNAVTQSVAQTFGETAERKTEKPPGLWTAFRRMRGRDALRGIALMITLLEKLGKNLALERSDSHEQQK